MGSLSSGPSAFEGSSSSYSSKGQVIQEGTGGLGSIQGASHSFSASWEARGLMEKSPRAHLKLTSAVWVPFPLWSRHRCDGVAVIIQLFDIRWKTCHRPVIYSPVQPGTTINQLPQVGTGMHWMWVPARIKVWNENNYDMCRKAGERGPCLQRGH